MPAPATPHPLAMNTAAAAEMTAPVKQIRLIENMLAPPVSLSLSVLPFTGDHISKRQAKPTTRVTPRFPWMFTRGGRAAHRPTTPTTCTTARQIVLIAATSDAIDGLGREEGAHHLGELALRHRRRGGQVLREDARRRIAGGGIHGQHAAQEVGRR